MPGTKSSLSLLISLLLLAATSAIAAPPDTFTDAEREAIKTFLEKCVAGSKAAIVVGLVDKNGSSVLSAGTLDNGTDRPVDGDTAFFIGSVSKTFTSLLLLEMADRGEVQLDDPVAKYLPADVSMPTYQGKPITLRHLATQTSGLPFDPDNMKGADWREKFESYTVDEMYAFLGTFTLTHEPGTRVGYSNLGMSLLGHALERRAGKSFETLVIERICQPLGMDGTRITLMPEMKSHLAMGREANGDRTAPWQFKAYHPAGDIHSSANDLLKYASAQAGLTRTPLSPLMEESHVFRNADTNASYDSLGRVAMPWFDRNALQPPNMDLRAHAGGAGSYHAWVGFDKRQRRGVVVLSTVNDVLSVEAIGWTILQRLPLKEERKLQFARELIGVGVALSLNEVPRGLRISRVYPGSPAAAAGLADGEIILKIDDVVTAGKTVAQCTDLIRGPAGTQVRLELTDAQQMASRTVEVTRQRFAT